MPEIVWMREDDEGDEHEVFVPANWEICDYCRGEGHHCRHLGAYGAEEFNHEFSYEEQEAYRRGDYDKTCEVCGGTGKVLAVDFDAFEARDPAMAKEYKDDMRAEAAYQAEVRSELRFIYGITD